jgi:magnesium transporter
MCRQVVSCSAPAWYAREASNWRECDHFASTWLRRLTAAPLQGSMKVGYTWQEALAALEEPGEPRIPIYRVRSWRIGAVMYLGGNVLQFLSFAFAAQSLLLALSSAQFATHLFFAWLMEGVRVPRRCIYGAGIIMGFNVLLVIYSSKASVLYKAEELLQLFR